MSDFKQHNLVIPDDLIGQRLDKALSILMDDFSRGTIQTLIKEGLVLVDDEAPTQKDKVRGGESVNIVIPTIEQGEWEAQNIDLDIIYEDADMLVINKPAGLVVHPGAGNPDHTLLNALLYHYPKNRELPRAGIVHRLDKDTSGLMVVAKSEVARLGLIEQLVDHTLHREYLAVTLGQVISGGTVDEPIARDKYDRRKMSINMMGKEAVTHFRVQGRYRNHTLLVVQLETGRTHQIRVHMQHLGYPLVGDPVYGRRLAIPKDCLPELEQVLRAFKRQALHAVRIAYIHPVSGENQSWECDISNDMKSLITACEHDNE